MGSVEGWLTQRHKFGDDKRVRDDLRARAKFALCCEIGSDKEGDGASSERNQSEYQSLRRFPSEYLALEKVKKGEMFEGAKKGKYADEYLAMLQHRLS